MAGAISLTGDFAALNAIVTQLEEAPEALLAANENMAEESIDLVRQGWRKQRAPDGKKWKVKVRPDGRAILVRTGTLRNSFAVTRVDLTGFTITGTANYGGFHQSGTSRMVARKMVPENQLPAKWEIALNNAAEDALEEHFGG